MDISGFCGLLDHHGFISGLRPGNGLWFCVYFNLVEQFVGVFLGVVMIGFGLEWLIEGEVFGGQVFVGVEAQWDVVFDFQGGGHVILFICWEIVAYKVNFVSESNNLGKLQAVNVP